LRVAHDPRTGPPPGTSPIALRTLAVLERIGAAGPNGISVARLVAEMRLWGKTDSVTRTVQALAWQRMIRRSDDSGRWAVDPTLAKRLGLCGCARG
jgi:DNA-binding IclR family transcriptional regulator